MNYRLNLNDRPFKAIKAGTKKIEGRVKTSWEKTPLDKLQAGDILTFTNNVTYEQMNCEVLAVRHYKDVRAMLEAEGVQNVLSSGEDIEGGIESYNTHTEYKENIPKFGIYAIAISRSK